MAQVEINVPDITGNSQADIRNLYDTVLSMKREYDWALQNLDQENMTQSITNTLNNADIKVDSVTITPTSFKGTLAGETVIDISIQSDTGGNINKLVDNLTSEEISITLGGI